MTPYQVLYGKLPPTILPYVLGSSKNVSLNDMLIERDNFLRVFKENLTKSKAKMELQANGKRMELEFNVGDQVLLKFMMFFMCHY